MFGKKNPMDEKPLNIFIVGCGNVGIALVDALTKEGNNVTLIDKNEALLDEISGQYDIMTYTGNGASYVVLSDSGIEEADLLIAVTNYDEQNLLCCLVASQIANCSTIARVRTPDYNDEVWYLRDRLGIAMVINPDLEAATEISQILNLPAATEVNNFARGQASMVRFDVEKDSILDGGLLSDIMIKNDFNLLFTAVERDGVTSIPNGGFRFKEGDSVSFVSARRNLMQSLRSLGIARSPLKSYMLIGGDRIAYYLAKSLTALGLDVKIIEEDLERCKELSLLLPKATVINGNGSDARLLNEEGIALTDAVIALTGIDEVNVMLSIYAKKVSNAKVITKIDKQTKRGFYDGLGLGSIVYPRVITTDMILRYARAKRVASEDNIESLYHMFDGTIEAIEFNITKDDKGVVGKTLSELDLDDNVMIAFIQRGGRIILPKGSDSIQVGDSVMIVTTNFGYNNIGDILK